MTHALLRRCRSSGGPRRQRRREQQGAGGGCKRAHRFAAVYLLARKDSNISLHVSLRAGGRRQKSVGSLAHAVHELQALCHPASCPRVGRQTASRPCHQLGCPRCAACRSMSQAVALRAALRSAGRAPVAHAPSRHSTSLWLIFSLCLRCSLGALLQTAAPPGCAASLPTAAHSAGNSPVQMRRRVQRGLGAHLSRMRSFSSWLYSCRSAVSMRARSQLQRSLSGMCMYCGAAARAASWSSERPLVAARQATPLGARCPAWHALCHGSVAPLTTAPDGRQVGNKGRGRAVFPQAVLQSRAIQCRRWRPRQPRRPRPPRSRCCRNTSP